MLNPDPVWFVNAFAADYFGGNTAAVVLLADFPDDSRLLALAKEFGFSETAFLKALAPARYHIRWFTPEVEVPLCGHATLASARALFSGPESGCGKLSFTSLSGELAATLRGDLIELDFPAENSAACSVEPALVEALGPHQPLESLSARNSRNLVLVYAEHQQVLDLQPEFPRLAAMTGLPWLGIAVTAPCPEGYICRYFAPWEGINEDPVTGSAQTYLAPYWSAKLGLGVLNGWQASQRGGTFEVEISSARVLIRGRAFLYLRGKIDSGWKTSPVQSPPGR